MIRTVPETTSEGIELYIRTYYSLLRSSGDVRIRSLEETHEGMRSSLHLGEAGRCGRRRVKPYCDATLAPGRRTGD